jgi:CRP-like cAMP-binding protein/Zn-dependent protease
VSAIEARPGLWGELAARIEATPAPSPDGEEPDLWDRLFNMTDLAQYRPKLSDDIEIKEFKMKWGNDYAMAANLRDLLHYRLDPGEVDLLKLMDGTRTVKEIVVERFKDSGDLELSGVADLVYQLHIGNFLDDRYLDVDAAVKKAIKPETLARTKAKEFATTLRLEWKNADAFVRRLYRYGLKFLFHPVALGLSVVFALAGIAAFVSNVHSGRFNLTGQSLALGFLILLGFQMFHIFLHELGHALVLIHYKRRVVGAGFFIFFGAPAFFIESSDGLMLDRGQRIVQSAAGPYSGLLVSGAFSILVHVLPVTALSQLLYKFTVLAYLNVFLNSLPMLELDGYWILADAIQVPDLRPRSLAFVRHDLIRKLWRREHWSKPETGLALYGVVGAAFTIFSFYTAYFFWQQIFGGLVSRLWHGGLLTRIILLGLALFVGGPLIRAGISVIRALARRLRTVVRALRFRLESKWRVEAAALIDALPVFDDVPVDALNELAGRVKLKSFGRGQPVVRQGERAQAFYVVRKGTLEVVEEDRETANERTLRILGHGESFGELGLTEAAPRTATVRGLEDGEVFEIDKSTFDRLLADMVNVPEFAPTLQAASELREIKCFAYLDPADLAELMDRGEWVNFMPGETIVEQGAAGDAFYGIRSGQVEVFEDGELVRTMGPGSFFGEIALLLDVPRTATVVARTPVRAYRLDQEGFDRLVRDAFKRGTLNPVISPDRVWEH